jgi:hypothetical protein
MMKRRLLSGVVNADFLPRPLFNLCVVNKDIYSKGLRESLYKTRDVVCVSENSHKYLEMIAPLMTKSGFVNYRVTLDFNFEKVGFALKVSDYRPYDHTSYSNNYGIIISPSVLHLLTRHKMRMISPIPLKRSDGTQFINDFYLVKTFSIYDTCDGY